MEVPAGLAVACVRKREGKKSLSISLSHSRACAFTKATVALFLTLWPVVRASLVHLVRHARAHRGLQGSHPPVHAGVSGAHMAGRGVLAVDVILFLPTVVSIYGPTGELTKPGGRR